MGNDICIKNIHMHSKNPIFSILHNFRYKVMRCLETSNTKEGRLNKYCFK